MGYFSFLQLNRYIRVFILSVVVYLGMQYVVPLIWPFIIGGIVAKLLYQPTCKIQRKTNLPMGIVSFVMVLFTVTTTLIIVWVVGNQMFYRMKDIIAYGHHMEEEIESFINMCYWQIERTWGLEQGQVEIFLMDHASIAIDNMQVNLLPRVMAESYGYVKWIVATIATIIVTVIATLLIAKDYEKMKNYIYCHEELRKSCGVLIKVGEMLQIFLKSQLIIMSIITIICVAGFFLLEPESAIYLGVVTGLLDAVPFIGTGIVFIPLAMIYLIQDQVTKAILAIIIWLLSSLVRDYLEPKFIGDKLGYLPIIILLTIYLGIQIYGIMGILLGPISFMLVNEWNALLEVDTSLEQTKKQN
ncbi:MAG: AI-2E family transporter [Eubacteriales bacterium]